MLSVVSFGKQIGLIMHFKYQFPYYNRVLQNVSQNGITGTIIWDFGDIIRYFYFFVFVYKMYLFAITAYFLSFPDKNLWFSSQRRREGVVGDANGSISK